MSKSNATSGFYEQLSDIGYEMLLGPYHCWGVVEVYRLEANRKHLGQYVKQVLGDLLKGSGVSVALPAHSSAVYLVHYQFDTLIAQRELGVFDDNSSQFHVPVVVTIKGEQARLFAERSSEPMDQNSDGTITFEASIPVYSYGAHMINVITSNELRGQGMAHAEIRSNQQLCLDDFDAASASKRLVDIRPLMSPPDRQDSGETLQRQSMVQIWNKHPQHNRGSSGMRDTAQSMSDERSLPLSSTDHAVSKEGDLRKIGQRAAAAKFSAYGLTALSHIFDLITLKQFPHDRDPKRACYQSVIHIKRRVMVENRKQEKFHEPLFAAEHAFVETVWDLEGKIGADDPRLQSCCVLINAEHKEADMVKALGLAFESEVVLDESGHATRYYELKPTAYIKMNSDLGEPSVCFEEAQGQAMGYRTNTLGPNNGWLSR